MKTPVTLFLINNKMNVKIYKKEHFQHETGIE